jgi:isoleucyl-tRNA synthetase
MEDWSQVNAIRDEVNNALATKRQEGVIGSGLAAVVTLYASDSAQSLLAKLGDELRFILITSAATVCPMSECTSDVVKNEELGIAIHVEASTHVKCDRCWHRREDVGRDSTHPELCLRCVGNITGHDELRHFA